MKYQRLGNSGLQVSVVGLGCNNFGRRCDVSQTAAVTHAALDAGITLFDTADIYGPGGLSEEYLGKALQGHRHEAVIASKFGGPMADDDIYMKGASRRYIMEAVEASLRRLNTDHLDLYQIHFPDPGTPLDETLRALDDLVTAGKVRYIGNSNFAGWQIASSEWISRTAGTSRYITAQNEYSLMDRSIEAEVIPAALEFGLSILPYFPLASGLLTGKYFKGEAGPEGARLSGDTPRHPVSVPPPTSTRSRIFAWSPMPPATPCWNSPSAGLPTSPPLARSSPGPPVPDRSRPTPSPPPGRCPPTNSPPSTRSPPPSDPSRLLKVYTLPERLSPVTCDPALSEGDPS